MEHQWAVVKTCTVCFWKLLSRQFRSQIRPGKKNETKGIVLDIKNTKLTYVPVPSGGELLEIGLLDKK
jgi:hypothetical protein